MKHSQKTKQEAVRLRVEEQLGLLAISDRLGVSKSILSKWLKNNPLSSEIIEERYSKSMEKLTGRGYDPGPASKYKMMLQDQRCTSDIGRIAEIATYFRMSLLGWDILTSPFDGATSDVVAGVRGTLYKIQVKTARLGRHGRPYFRTTSSRYQGDTQYKPDEVDFFVGYFLHTDECYVFSREEAQRNHKTCDQEALEAWWKIDPFLKI